MSGSGADAAGSDEGCASTSAADNTDTLLGPMDELDLLPEEGPQGEAQELATIVTALTTSSTRKEGGGKRPEAEGQGHSVAPVPVSLQPTFATCTTPMLGTNTLHEIDRAAQVQSALMNVQFALMDMWGLNDLKSF